MAIISALVLEQMFLKHYQEWCLLSFSYVGDLDDSKDVVQSIFVKLLQKECNEPIKDFKSYISTSIRNESLKRIKKKQRTFLIKNYSNEVPSYEHELIRSEISQTLFREIDALPDQTRKVFELCVLEGVKYENAAEIMGITVNTVKYHLKKTFKILRLNLKDVYFWVL
ncbi:sigma-70 family RNA polymerase sigma factor [Maribacter confluentis]|uniref:Sigma-70 family RNA polymerase sigma factor n=1 Tax=Maribacter confluentis TaxID=1656093 RepID=A0ABT8RMJ1_9FLAO|nr:sigma-70 family RNA polymerase sigma factor [Maribacter confluentis]MDO1511682.1 sigma-70 family RNA polymerase sigma factor [Maribacter confluentis]